MRSFGRVWTFLVIGFVMLSGCAPSPWPQPAQTQWTPQGQGPVIVQPPVVQNPWQPEASLREWRHIVIHHTASSSGSIDSIHEAHLGRGWDGIGYHFLIGNGNGMGDGEIESTFRWREQMHGAHAGKEEYNQHGIGICLVGNFEDSHPSEAQLEAVKRLVGVLKREYGIASSGVIAHRDVKATACPGKNFPLDEVAQSQAADGVILARIVDMGGRR